MKSLKKISLQGKRVLLRVDFNVPLDPKTHKISDTSRIRACLPTLHYLLKQGAQVILMSHLGRPKGKVMKEFRLDPVATVLERLLKVKVKKLSDCVGDTVEREVAKMTAGQVVLLENLRFHVGEEKNDPHFAKKLARLGDLFVNDAFGTVHRAHASTEGIAHLIPSYPGFLLEKEISALSPLLGTPRRPFVLILGGAKIDTKLGILKNFLHKVDFFLIGGGLANTFLKAQGYDIGDSLYEANKVEVAQELMLEAEKFRERFVLPGDVVVADEISDTSETVDIPVEDVEGKMKILDIGEKTTCSFCHIIEEASTIVWNGPVGLIEYKPFRKGSRAIAEAMAHAEGTTIVGGGDTLEALRLFDLKEDSFDHVSTGGGAMLEFLEGKKLPGIEVLERFTA